MKTIEMAKRSGVSVASALAFAWAFAASSVSAQDEEPGAAGESPALPASKEIVATLASGPAGEASRLTVRLASLSAEDRLPDRENLVNLLQETYQDEAVPAARRRLILRVIAETGGAESAYFLVWQLKGREEETVVPAVKAAGRLLARHKGSAEEAGGRDRFKPSWVAPAMERLLEELMEMVEERTGPVRAAAMDALREAGQVEAVPALVRVLREAPELRASAQQALVEISGRDLPQSPGAWSYWYDTVASEEPLTSEEAAGVDLKELEEAVAALPDGPPPPAPAPGRLMYLIIGLCAGGLAMLLPFMSAAQRKRLARAIEKGRRKVRRRFSE